MDAGGSFVDAGQLQSKYPHFCTPGATVRVFLNRIFNEKREVVQQARKTSMLQIIMPKQLYGVVRLDTGPLLQLGIAKNQIPEILAMNFVLADGEVPILPNEFEVDAFDTIIRERIVEELSALQAIGVSFETVGVLHQWGFHDIANDLTEGLVRMEKNDYDGAIKFFRKVVEGFKVISDKQGLDPSKNRSDAISDFLSKSYGLISNLGEHYGTYGGPDAAVFSRDITVAVARYLAPRASLKSNSM